MADNFKDRIQKELEELSWEFLLEKDAKDEQQQDFLDEVVEKNNQPERHDQSENKQLPYEADIDLEDLYHNEELSSWYTGGGGYGLNDMGRDRGIVFDEDKLERARVTEWHKPPKLKKSWLEKLAKGVAMIIFWPLRAIYFVVANFLRGLAGIVGETANLVYKILKAIIILPWQFVVAFKHTFVYLFGDFSWLKARQLEPLPVAATLEPWIIRLADINIWKKVGVFTLLAVLLVLPLQLYISLN